MHLPAGTDGIHGGREPWTVQIIRTTAIEEYGHWWQMNAEEPEQSGLTIFRDEADQICRVTLVSAEAFEVAATRHGLDPEVFGSPTLWPAAHRPEGRSGRAFGWAWTFSGADPFPFTSEG